MIDKQDFAALRYMKQGRVLAQQLLRQNPDEYDALLALGVRTYLTGIKPAPVRWMLSLGGIDPNEEQGIRESSKPPHTEIYQSHLPNCCWR